MLASLMSGVRWSLTQILLKPHHGSSKQQQGQEQHPIISVLYLSPMMGIFLLLASIWLELDLLRKSDFFSSLTSSMYILAWMALGGIVAFSMVLAEFEVIRRIGVVSLSVAGIFKVLSLPIISSNGAVMMLGSNNYWCIFLVFWRSITPSQCVWP